MRPTGSEGGTPVGGGLGATEPREKTSDPGFSGASLVCEFGKSFFFFFSVSWETDGETYTR